MSNAKFELSEEELDQVTGGETIVQSKYNRVLFTTINKYGTFKNGATANDVDGEVRALKNQNPNLSEEEFDTLARNHLKGLGMI